jgi:anti-sigma factor RsiW
MTKRGAPRRGKPSATKAHRHEKGRCLHILRELSAYIDDELSGDICLEIRRHLGACPNCEDFVASLRQTVSLCRHSPAPALSSSDRARMRASILQTAQAR